MTCPSLFVSRTRCVARASHLACLFLISYTLIQIVGVRTAPPQAAPLPSHITQQEQTVKDEPVGNKSNLSASDSRLSVNEKQMTANLSALIDETLKINGKPTSRDTLLSSSGAVAHDGGKLKQQVKDDWTFDRVEYDLMDFLQDLNRRYGQSNSVTSFDNSDPLNGLSTGNSGDLVKRANHHQNGSLVAPVGNFDETTIVATGKPTVQNDEHVVADATAPSVAQEQQPKRAMDEIMVRVTTSTVDQVKKELDEISVGPNDAAPAQEGEKFKSTTPPSSFNEAAAAALTTRKPNQNQMTQMASSSGPLAISLASGDHDISESTWQYGIFDRFTRPRASSTTSTTLTPDLLAMSGTNSNLDVRSFNSDECGLRNYRPEPDYYPVIGAVSGSAGIGSDASSLEGQEETMTKELSQRRQRPPLGSSFFSSHKKYHLSASGSLSIPYENRDDPDRDKSPPYDRYGEPASLSEPSNTSKYHRDKANVGGGGGGAGGSDSAEIADSGDAQSSATGDSEFNLSLRRQWMQQQLGNTLQILGFNSTNGNLAPQTMGDFMNQSAFNSRENMMKMSASGNKLAKSYVPVAASGGGSDPISPSEKSKEQQQQQELKARQDELKLEARVIGGNDARLGDSPWSASLQALVSRPGTGAVEYRHYCGGTIISEYYILTAAHCLDFMVGRESRLFVVIGDLNWRMSAASLHGRRFGIEKLIIHGGYKSTAFGHDIGLIKTKESMKALKVNGRYIVNSVCLPERNIEHTGEAELVGWGLFSNRNEMADSLQIADVPILPRPLCVDLYRRRTGLIQWLIGIELITEKQICAGTFGRGICQGDSGSALVHNEKVQFKEAQPDGKAAINRLRASLATTRDQQQRATIIGTVAFGGIRRCSYQSLPGVYMQTSKYLDWILPRIQA